MKVCFITSECVPFVKTGGLADVSGSLPVALSNLGCKVKIFLPLYDLIDINRHNLKIISEFKNNIVQVGEKKKTFNLFYGKLPDSNVEVYFIDCSEYYNRRKVYTDDEDEDERFIFFQNAVLITLPKLQWSPDIMHCNDWQASLIPVYLKTNFDRDSLFSETATLLSIHNIGYQGRFPKETLLKANLSYKNYYPDGPYELDDSFCFLKTGIMYSDIISTVSPTYAKEIQTSEFGAGLDNVLRDRKNDLYGILNGIDTKAWNPETDKIIPYNYTYENLDNKQKNKKELLKFCGLIYEEDTPVIGIVSRLAWQKGFELLVPIFDELMEQKLKIVILGDGEKKYEDFFRKVSLKYADKVFLYIGYNNELAHLITAGSDMFLMPSRYEPCGLNQMYSLNYGTVAIVRKTGGLADTVIDYDENKVSGNGFSFDAFEPTELLSAIKRALNLYEQKDKWNEIMKRGMQEDFSWAHSAREYLRVYEKAKKSV